MKYLIIDTASTDLVVAVYFNYDKQYECIIERPNNMSSILLSKIAEAMDEAKIRIQDIDCIFVINGPGSFTGIRIGVTVAKTIAWAFHKKVVPISELLLLATTEVDTDCIVPYIDARRGYVYAGIYDKNLNVILEDQYISKDALLKLIETKRAYTFVSYDDMIANTKKPNLKLERLIMCCDKFPAVTPHQLNPNYLKKTEAEEKLEQHD